MKFLIKACLAAAAAVMTLAAPLLAYSQAFPNKPVNMVVAFPAGGPSDVLGRIVAKSMADGMGQPVIVENVVGVGGSLGVLKVAGAADGHTVMMGSPLELIYTPLGIAAAKNKPTDMRMVALAGHTHIALVTRKDLPVSTLEEFVALAKKSEKPLSFGSTGVGSFYHLLGEKVLSSAGAKGLHAPYNGLAPYLKDLIGGVIDFAIVPLGGPVLGAIDGGQIKALAVAANAPIARFPKLPTMRSTKGFEDFEFSIWIGLQTSAKTPDAQVAALHKAAYAAINHADVKKSLDAAGTATAEPMTLQQLDAFYKKETAAGAALAKSINLQPQ